MTSHRTCEPPEGKSLECKREQLGGGGGRWQLLSIPSLLQLREAHTLRPFARKIQVSMELGVLDGQKGGYGKGHGLTSSLSPDLLHHPKEEDVVIEDFEEDSEAEGSGGEDDIRELRAKKLALARKIAEQQRRQEKIQVGLVWRGWFPSGW